MQSYYNACRPSRWLILAAFMCLVCCQAEQVQLSLSHCGLHSQGCTLCTPARHQAELACPSACKTSGGVQAGDALKSHSHWVTDLAWHPTSPHQLLSASYDKTVKQWDVRAAVPLHTLTAHTDKVSYMAQLGC